jgi:uncharacterized protein YbjT (DUF2867 family)
MEVIGFAQDTQKANKHLKIKLCDFDEIDSKLDHVKKCDCFVIVPPSGGNKMDVVRKYLEVCKRANVKHIIVVSTLMPKETEDLGKKYRSLQEFRDMEKMVTDSGLQDVCIVRLGFYMENLLAYRDQIAHGSLPLPLGPDDAMAPVCLRDAAQGILELCKQSITKNKFPREVVQFTGTKVCTPVQMAEAAGEALGTKVEYKQISERDADKILSKAPMEDREASLVLEMYGLTHEGKLNFCTKDLNEIAHKGTTLRNFFSMHKNELVA